MPNTAVVPQKTRLELSDGKIVTTEISASVLSAYLDGASMADLDAVFSAYDEGGKERDVAFSEIKNIKVINR